MTARQEVKKGTPAEEKSIFEAMQILRIHGAFLRRTESEEFPYEAVRPGNWTVFRSRGLRKEAAKILMDREKL